MENLILAIFLIIAAIAAIEEAIETKLGWEKRALEGVMKLLKAPVGLLYAPVSQAEIPKEGIGIIPWGYWS